MIAWLLIQKIFSLFLILLAAFVLVRRGVLCAGDSKVLSLLSIHLIMPCMILSSFQIDYTPEVRDGLLLAFGTAVLLHVGLGVICWAVQKLLHFDTVEALSTVYPNAGNLIVPLVTAILGPEYIIYASAFLSVQQVLIWTHAISLLNGERTLNVKKIVTNVNMLAIFAGILLFATHLRLPAPIQDAVSTVGGTIGPVSMIVTGMLIGGTDLRRIFGDRRLWRVVAMRLLVVPLLAMLFLKYSGLARLVPGGETVLLVSLLATTTPAASTITQLVQVYGKDAEYANAINVVTTLLCIVTMPLIVFLYQL